jgi:MSHA biogenesis protein MshI
VLGRKSYRILVAEEPAVRVTEMEQSLRWAVSTMIDYPIDDAVVSWMRIPTEKLMPNRPPHLYVVVARKDLVNGYRDLFKNAKLPLKAVDVRETAHRNIAALVARDGEGIGMLSVSLRGVQFTVTYQGELFLDRYVDETFFGAHVDAAMRERASERLVLQVQRSLDFIGRTLPFIDVNRLILAPMPGEIGLRDRLAENISVPVEALDLNTVFDLSKVPELASIGAQANYFVALGGALRFNT